MSLIRGLVALSIVTLLPVVSSCQGAYECGPGTLDRDGVCMPMNGPPLAPRCCGPYTHYDGSAQACLPDLPPMVCDAVTGYEVVNAEGIIECRGKGGTTCELPCEQPAPGFVTLCGRIIDAETSEPLATGTRGVLCDGVEATGPCSVEIAFYDALEFANDPSGATPRPYDSLLVNECGYFAVKNVPAPQLGFLGIGVDDHPDSGADVRVLTGVALPASGGERIDDLVVQTVRRSTDQAWTVTAGSPFGGATFSERGAVLMTLLDNEVPTPGARITENGSPQPNSDYYFSDTDPSRRTTVDPVLTETGANGTGLLVDSELVNHSGSGAERDGCTWAISLADAIPGVIFATSRRLLDDNGQDCP